MESRSTLPADLETISRVSLSIAMNGSPVLPPDLLRRPEDAVDHAVGRRGWTKPKSGSAPVFRHAWRGIEVCSIMD
jgi:hypothetical protein